MTGWERFDGILMTERDYDRIAPYERGQLLRLRQGGWTVRIEAASATTVTVERDDHCIVVHDSTLRLALALAIEETGA